MLPLTQEEIEDIKINKNIEIEKNREKDYKSVADPLYMGYVKIQH